MKTSKVVRKPVRPAPVSVIKVERSGQNAIAYEIVAGTSTPTKRKLEKALKPLKQGTDLFASPTLPDTLSNAFKEAVLSAKQKYG